ARELAGRLEHAVSIATEQGDQSRFRDDPERPRTAALTAARSLTTAKGKGLSPWLPTSLPTPPVCHKWARQRCPGSPAGLPRGPRACCSGTNRHNNPTCAWLRASSTDWCTCSPSYPGRLTRPKTRPPSATCANCWEAPRWLPAPGPNTRNSPSPSNVMASSLNTYRVQPLGGVGPRAPTHQQRRCAVSGGQPDRSPRRNGGRLNNSDRWHEMSRSASR